MGEMHDEKKVSIIILDRHGQKNIIIIIYIPPKIQAIEEISTMTQAS